MPTPADAVVIGAGPVGLFQVFELGLLGIRAHVIDALPQAGGQPVELYGDKPIYDIPGIPVCTGRELVERLLQQVAPFGAQFHYHEEVTRLEPQPGGGFLVEASGGTSLLAKTVFIAAGAGAFRPRALKVEGAAAFEGSQLLYRANELGALTGRQVVVHGATDAAVNAALALSQPGAAASVALVWRRDVFDVPAADEAALRDAIAAGRIRLVIGQPLAVDATGGRLSSLRVALAEGGEATVPADTVLALLGLSPRLGPVADWGLDLERKQLKVDTATFSTRVPGIFAVGDINTYPGKKKLILCGFHECALASFAAAEIVFPGEPAPLQYTTTSPKLHARLGVDPQA